MKKLIAFLLLAAMLLGLPACTDEKKDSGEDDTSAAVSDTSETGSGDTSSPEEVDTRTGEYLQYDVKLGMTEEELGVYPVGRYTITPSGTEALGVDKDFHLSVGGENTAFTIIYQMTGDRPYYFLCPADSEEYVLALPSKSNGNYKEDEEVTALNRADINPDMNQDNYCYMQWQIKENDNGTVSFFLNSYNATVNRTASAFCLSLQDGKLTIEKKASAQGITEFHIEMTQRGSDQFRQFISDKGNITLRLPILSLKRSGLSDARAQEFANDVQKAYESFIELTSYTPYEHIIVKAYSPTKYMAYITANYNTITVGDDGDSGSWYITDLKEMVMRGWEVNDWNFCILHEMGHMFDTGRGWYFETEMMTDLKLVYCLEMNDACAAPSECAAKQYYYADGKEEHLQIEEAYENLGKGGVDSGYNFYGAALVMLRIQRQIGWDAFKQTYAYYNEGTANDDALKLSKYERFELFISKLSEYSGKDVKSLFTQKEWDTFMAHYGYTA